MYRSVTNVKALDDFYLELTFENNELRLFDVKPYLNHGIFRELKNQELFNIFLEHLFLNKSLGSQTGKNFVNFRVIKENLKTKLIEVEMSFPIFRLEKIDLIELTNKHLKNLLEVYSDDRVTEFMDIYSMKTLEEVNKEWVQWADKQFNDSTGIRWGILLEEKMVGTCGFHNIHIKDKKKIAEIGYDLKYEYWGKGLFYEILPIIIKFAFSELHIDEIHALIFPENIRSKKMIVKHGFCFQNIIQLDEPCKNRFIEEELYIYKKQN